MKKKFFKRAGALIIAGCLLAGTLAGCSNNTSSTDSAASSSSATEDGTYTLQVESIDGQTVSGTIGELTQATAPSSTTDSSTSSTDGTTSATSSGTSTTDGTTSATSGGAESDGSSMPSDMPSGAPSGMPSGDSDAMPSGDMGDMPSGDMPSDASGGMPGGGGGAQFTAGTETIEFTISNDAVITVESTTGSQTGTIDDIVVGSVLEVTISGGTATDVTVKNITGSGGADASADASFGGSSTVTNGTSANTIDTDSDISDESYTSTGDDENALRVDSATVTLDGVTIEKSSGESSNTEDGDFYGQNAAFLALNGATVTITDSTFTSSAQNGNGVFSYGEGTTVNISDSTIRTTENNSGGIQTTGGGTMNATNLDIETQGNSSAAIRSDRGGGTVIVDGGTYTTNGTGSPAVYSTADITVSNATLIGNASEGVVIEGMNSVELVDTDVTGSMQGTYGTSSENIHAIMIYQSMSGDANVGTSSFSASGGSITSLQGDLIYVTNTSCTIDLSSVELTLANDTLLRIEGNDASQGWGTVGANGGDVVFTADAQVLKGNIIVDDISTLGLTLSNGSSFTGAINTDGAAGDVSVTLDSNSTWTLTGDSYITTFNGDASDIVANGYTVYVNGTALA